MLSALTAQVLRLGILSKNIFHLDYFSFSQEHSFACRVLKHVLLLVERGCPLGLLLDYGDPETGILITKRSTERTLKL